MALTQDPWYRTAWAAMLLLALFPPVGLYLTWKYQGWNIRTKRIVTGAATLWLAGVIAGITVAVVLTVGGDGGDEERTALVEDPQLAALQKLEAAAEGPVDVDFQNGFPRFVHVSVPVQGADAVERARSFLETYRDLYLQTSPNLGLAVRDMRADEVGGSEHVAFYQTYRGYPVHAGEIVVSLDGDRVYATVGSLLSDVVLNAFPGISPREAEEIARDDIELPADAPIFGDTSLLVFDRSLFDDVEPAAHLAWDITLGAREPWRAFVDAHTGEVLFKFSLIDAHTDYDLDLEDANSNSASNSNCYWNTTDDDQIGDEDGMDSDYFGDQEAVNAWWWYFDVYNFYHDTFGRHSYDGSDGQLEVYVHAGVKNAAWIGSSFDCDLIDFANGWVAYDVMVHEFNHGVMDFRPISPLMGSNQPGALEESLADTFAYLAEPNCPMGEGTAGGAIRDFCNPPNYAVKLDDVGVVNIPDQMSEFVNTTDDDGGEHVNLGILSKAAFLIAEGGTHPGSGVAVIGIGRTKMGKLYYAVEDTLTSGTQFIDFRNKVVETATQWGGNGSNGFTPQNACQVRNAFFAVELGNGDNDCDGIEDPVDPDDDNDSVIDANDNCPLTFNPNQTDTDGDTLGDACDLDDDNDGVPDSEDNCDLVPNPGQADGAGDLILDGSGPDGVGDACDDDDGDGVLNTVDNCVRVYNPDQANIDSHLDADGDACDPDVDGDGISNDDDNCFQEPNPDQADIDGDLTGDACDPCPEVPLESPAWGYIKDPLTGETTVFPIFDDADGDTIPDACDDSFFMTVVVDPSDKDQFLKPDGQSREVDTEADPNSYLKIPLAPCPPPADRRRVPATDDSMTDTQGITETMSQTDVRDAFMFMNGHRCMDALPQGEIALLVLSDLHPQIRPWVSDDEGRSVDTRGKDDVRVLRFRPQGGRTYFLNLSFGPDFEPGQRQMFSAVMTVGPAEELTGPHIEEVSPPGFLPPPPLDAPTPEPTATATPTARATPTETPREAAAPTATLTPLPTSTATPTDTPSPTQRPGFTPRPPPPTNTRIPPPN